MRFPDAVVRVSVIVLRLSGPASDQLSYVTIRTITCKRLSPRRATSSRVAAMSGPSDVDACLMVSSMPHIRVVLDPRSMSQFRLEVQLNTTCKITGKSGN